MGSGIIEKIITDHLVSGTPDAGSEIAVRIDQTLTQDATGTMAYLEFEALGVPRVRTEFAVSYVDHNTLQTSPNNAEDHAFLQSFAAKHGIVFSRPGNGICHQLHLERFSAPGKTLLGSDSHTPTGGGAGMLAIGAGGMDVAVAMAGEPFYLRMPAVIRVILTGELGPWVSAKDVILELLRRLSAKAATGKAIEYAGPGVATLSVPQRATITNMGAELGATTSVFPSDAVTHDFLAWQGRRDVWRAIEADHDAEYDETIDIDLAALEPMVAMPHNPDNVVPVREVADTPVHQVCIGSCTNSSVHDLETAAAILDGRRIHPSVSLTVSPGSRQVLLMIAASGALAKLVAAGARILECACGPCIGMGQAPAGGTNSLRTFNRNFRGRSGTPTAGSYLAGVEVAAASALTGFIADPRELGEPARPAMPAKALVDDSMFIAPASAQEAKHLAVQRGPNIKPLPTFEPLPDEMALHVVLKTGDNISTDDIMPAGAKVLPLRSNIPAIAEHVFEGIDPAFAERAKETAPCAVVGGSNYGQGSSREHAALAPAYLGVRAVLARDFARIHRSNLINFGILPLVFDAASDYNILEQGDVISLGDVRAAVKGRGALTARLADGNEIGLRLDLTEREAEVLLAGGLVNYTRSRVGSSGGPA